MLNVYYFYIDQLKSSSNSIDFSWATQNQTKKDMDTPF